MRRVLAFAAAGALLLLLLVGTSSSRAPQLAVAPSVAPGPAPAQTKRTLPTGVRVVQAAWGDAPSELGRKHEQEGNPEGPMAIAARGGELAVLDQVNRRVQRYSGGKPGATIVVGSDTVQDLAVMRGGRTAVLDRLAERDVKIYGADGKLVNTVPIATDDATGVFADDSGVYVEHAHAGLVRVADGDGTAASGADLAGRPSRDGQLALQVAIADAAAGELRVTAVDRASGSPSWAQTVRLDAPLLHVVLLDSDAAGNIYVAGEVGREQPSPPYELFDVHVMVARLAPTGAPRGTLELPALSPTDETFRPLTVDDNGTLYEMVAGDAGVEVMRFAFP